MSYFSNTKTCQKQVFFQKKKDQKFFKSTLFCSHLKMDPSAMKNIECCEISFIMSGKNRTSLIQFSLDMEPRTCLAGQAGIDFTPAPF